MSLRWQPSVVSVLVWMMIQISAVSSKENLLTDEAGKLEGESGWEVVSSDLLSSLEQLEALPDLLLGAPRSTDDPILHLPLDEALGASTFQDISGYGHEASCTGSSCPVAGQSGLFDAALSFDGTDDYLQVPHTVSFDFGTSQDFSVTLWVRSGDPHIWSSLVSNKSEWHWVTCGFIIAFWQDGAT
ncbi:hypothetical protein JXQ70_02965, partial [bacterium]|nr:hypothetical protein [bacterium]